MDTAPLLTTTGAAIAALLIPFLTTQVKRLPWPWLAGQGVTVNLALAVLAYAVAWLLDGAPRELVAQYLRTALEAGGLGSAVHTLLIHGPEQREYLP